MMGIKRKVSHVQKQSARIFFNKAYSCNVSKSDSTSGFVWIATGVYINLNYEQDLITHRTNENLHNTFACAFMLKQVPNHVDLSLCSNWDDYYYQRLREMYCSSCKLNFKIDAMFMTICGHSFLHNMCFIYEGARKGRTSKM